MLSSSVLNFAFQVSGNAKRGRNNSKEVEKPGEVVHVRARRGQATDSHSLAERVRWQFHKLQPSIFFFFFKEKFFGVPPLIRILSMPQ